MRLGVALFGVGILVIPMALADTPEKSEPRPLREFRGETGEEITGPVPYEVILDGEAYEIAWKKLGKKESPGPVDFSKELVFFATTRGSRMGLRLRDEGDGKLNASAMATRDLRPGLRYLFGVFARKDWKEINGQLIP